MAMVFFMPGGAPGWHFATTQCAHLHWAAISKPHQTGIGTAMLIRGVGGLDKHTVYNYSTQTEIVENAVLPLGIF
jgi:hypothetical protein